MSCQRAECKRAGRCGCGFKHGTEPATLYSDAPPIAPAPQWTTEPPRDAGWYWMRNEWYDTEPFPALFDGEWWTYRGSMVRHPPCAKEFWPVPIPEPPADSKEGTK